MKIAIGPHVVEGWKADLNNVGKRVPSHMINPTIKKYMLPNFRNWFLIFCEAFLEESGKRNYMSGKDRYETGILPGNLRVSGRAWERGETNSIVGPVWRQYLFSKKNEGVLAAIVHKYWFYWCTVADFCDLPPYPRPWWRNGNLRVFQADKNVSFCIFILSTKRLASIDIPARLGLLSLHFEVSLFHWSIFNHLFSKFDS